MKFTYTQLLELLKECAEKMAKNICIAEVAAKAEDAEFESMSVSVRSHNSNSSKGHMSVTITLEKGGKTYRIFGLDKSDAFPTWRYSNHKYHEVSD